MMAAPEHLDDGAVAWLAEVDPALAPLAVARPTPDDQLTATAADPEHRWTVHDVSWTPGSGCSVAYRRRLPGAAAELLAVWVDAAGWRRHDYRDDPAVPGARTVADPATVAGRLATALGERVDRVRIDPVRYRPGSRCVLRYDVDTPSRSLTLYAKVLDREAFAGLVPVARALDQVSGSSGLCPRLVAVWDDAAALVTQGVPGAPVGGLLADPATPAADRSRLGRRLGEVLASLHEVGDLPVPRWTSQDQVRALRGLTAPPAAADPDLGRRVSVLVDRLAMRPPAEEAPVPGHGGFRAGQVVAGPDGRLTVLDLDGCCLTDRERDLGTALAHLQWQSVRRPALAESLTQVQEAVLDGYRQVAAHGSLGSLGWWRAAGLVQVAVRRYRRLETADWPWVPALLDQAESLVDHWESRPRSGTGADLLDVRAMSSVLAPLLARHPMTTGSTVLESARPLAVAEGRRAVVRYSVRAPGRGPAVPVVAKAFTDPARAELLDGHLRLLHEGPFRVGALRVPEPMGVLSDHRLVLFRHVDGTPLSSVTAPVAAVDGVRRAALWLAHLHASGVRLSRELSLDHEAEVSLAWTADIARRHPDLGARVDRLARDWASAARRCGVVPRVPLHKDFHAGHVIVGDAVTVVDLDEARLGDPAFDVAHFCTYLQATCDGSSWRRLRDAFLETYAEAAGWSDQGTFGPFRAYTWLKIAKQRAVGSGPFPRVSPAVRSAEVDRAVREGQRCLDG